MRFQRYISSTSNIFVQNKLLKFLILLFAGLLIYSQIKIAGLAYNQRVILVPSGLSEKVSVGSSLADETYLRAMGVYAATLLYSTTPTTVESQYMLLSKLFSSEAYSKYSGSLLETASNQAKNMLNMTFRIEKITTEFTPKQEIRLWLYVDKYIFGSKQDVSKLHKLRIGYEIINGQFFITSLEEGE